LVERTSESIDAHGSWVIKTPAFARMLAATRLALKPVFTASRVTCVLGSIGSFCSVVVSASVDPMIQRNEVTGLLPTDNFGQVKAGIFCFAPDLQKSAPGTRRPQNASLGQGSPQEPDCWISAEKRACDVRAYSDPPIGSLWLVVFRVLTVMRAPRCRSLANTARTRCMSPTVSLARSPCTRKRITEG
jgi:hypothetical protein